MSNAADGRSARNARGSAVKPPRDLIELRFGVVVHAGQVEAVCFEEIVPETGYIDGPLQVFGGGFGKAARGGFLYIGSQLPVVHPDAPFGIDGDRAPGEQPVAV